MHRFVLTTVLLLTVIPSLGMAGVIIDANFATDQSQASISASSDADETPAPGPGCPDHWDSHGTMLGMSSNSVKTISNSSNAIGGWPVLFVKAHPPVDSILSLEEWFFVPDSPVLKIPKVPIV